jgi:exosortase
MSQVAVAHKPETDLGSQFGHKGWLFWGLLVASTLLSYARIVWELAVSWWVNPDYSHGFLIVPAVAYLLYEKRQEIAALPVRPSVAGLAIAVFSQVVHLVGFLGAEFFLQRLSLLMLVAGMVVFFLGWRHLWATIFGFVLVALAIPLPQIIFNQIALPLQLLASQVAEVFLNLAGVPVFRDGNVLQLARQTLNVTEACSGVRSLISLFSLGLMGAYFVPMKTWAQLLFVGSTVPVAIFTNAFRVFATGLLAIWFGPKAAEGFFHTFSGWVMFLVAMVILFLIYGAIHRMQRSGHAAAVEVKP